MKLSTLKPLTLPKEKGIRQTLESWQGPRLRTLTSLGCRNNQPSMSKKKNEDDWKGIKACNIRNDLKSCGYLSKKRSDFKSEKTWSVSSLHFNYKSYKNMNFCNANWIWHSGLIKGHNLLLIYFSQIAYKLVHCSFIHSFTYYSFIHSTNVF